MQTLPLLWFTSLLTINIFSPITRIYLLFSLQHYLTPFHPLTTNDTRHKQLLLHLLLKMEWVSCIFTYSYSLHHTHFFITIIHVGGSNGVNTRPMKHWLPFLNNTSPILHPENPFLTTEHWVQIYSNQKEINYILPFNIRASVETCPPKLHNLLQFSPPSIPNTLWASPAPSFVSFCDTHISSCFFFLTSDKDGYVSFDCSHRNLHLGIAVSHVCFRPFFF